MRRFVGHKWVIGAAALILVLGIAGVAVAATTGTTSSTGTTATAGTDASGNPVTPGGHGAWGSRLGCRGRASAAQNRVSRQMRDATLKLVRDKMSAADQATFDKLLAQEKDQQAALQNAAQALRDTNRQIRQMVAKTLGVTLPTTTTTQAPGGTQG